jgi:hypothetical protein
VILLSRVQLSSVGKQLLGRIFNVLEPVDECGSVEIQKRIQFTVTLHFVDLDTKPSIFKQESRLLIYLLHIDVVGKIGFWSWSWKKQV